MKLIIAAVALATALSSHALPSYAEAGAERLDTKVSKLAPATSPRPQARVKLNRIDYADAGTTVIGLSRGLVEANPVVSWAGNAAPVVGLGMKLGMKHTLVGLGYSTEQADRSVSIGSALGTCNNIAALAGAAPAASIAIGVGCAVWYAKSRPAPRTEVLIPVI
jgi:hypothetical protein